MSSIKAGDSPSTSAAKLSNVEDIYPLSPMQEGMLFHSLNDPESGVYFFQLGFQIQGDLNVQAFRRAWAQLVRRHSTLRTLFLWEDMEAVTQVVRKRVDLPWREEDWRDLSDAEQVEKWRRFLQADRRRGFDLKKAPLLRLALIRTSVTSYYFACSLHHLVMDGWCQEIMMREVMQMYEAYRTKSEPRLPAPKAYSAYIAWLQRQDRKKAESFWRNELQGFTVATRLAIQRQKLESEDQGMNNAEAVCRVRHDLTARLEAVARAQKLTLNAVVQGAFALLLSRYSGEKDVVFGAAVSGRSAPVRGIESMIGLFFNTLPVRVRMPEGETVTAFLKRLQERQVAARDFEYSPLLNVQKWSEVQRGTPLFEYMMVFANYAGNAAAPAAAGERPSGTISINLLESFEINNFPLTLTAAPADELYLRFDYDLGQFDPQSVERMLGHLGNIMEGLVVPEQPLSGISMLTEAERKHVVEEWNQTAVEYDGPACMHQLFERQVDVTPGNVAVVHGNTQLTYRELEQRANRLGHYLRKMGVGPEVRVGICVGRGLEMVLGMLGILKAGGAYVPLDPAYPMERVAYMVNDAGVKTVLTEQRLLGRLPASEEWRAVKLVSLDGDWERIEGESPARPAGFASPENLAYIYYTSGSTGRPKGVAIAHSGIANYIRWGVEAYGAREGNGAAVHSSIAVDLTLTNFLPLFTGKTMVLVQEGPGVDELVKLVQDEPRWSLLKITPTHLTLLNPQLTEREMQQSTQVLVIGADNLVAEPTLVWRKQAPGVKLLNEYGPTETVVGCSIYTIHEGSPRTGGVPIGRPIANMTMYVLDGEGQPLPVGVPGELYIGGIGVARGYWRRPELTAERFVPDEFAGRAGARFYRTGDRARLLADGNLEFLGRLDHQVKIRGFRIEPGEVEAVLSGCPGVNKAMAVVREDIPGEKRLVGYVAAQTGTVKSSDLRQYLLDRLPEYMVPVAFVVMESLPVRASGKIDPKDLPPPEMEGDESKYVAPRTDVERLLSDIWAQVLNVSRVGIHDNFFELGGDSILSIQVVTRAREAGVAVLSRQIFERQTIAELAEVAGSEASMVEAEQGVVSGPVPLTPIQAAFFEWDLARPEHYNQSVLLELAAELKTEWLEEVVGAILKQHDALRMKYQRNEEGEWLQTCAADLENVYERRDLSGLGENGKRAELERDAAQAQAKFDLAAGRLAKVVEYEMGGGQAKRLLLVIHHLIMDGVSWRILLDNLERGYEQKKQGEEVLLGAKTTSYKQWAEKLRAYGESGIVKAETQYWLEEERKKVRPLPRDYSGSEEANLFGTQQSVAVLLEEEETRVLLQDVPGVYHTQINDVLLTALGRTCSEWSGSGPVLIDLEGHGREDIFAHVDLSRTVGWFTSLYPVLLKVGDEKPWAPGRSLVGVKEQLRAVPNRGLGYGVLRYGARNEAVRQQLAEMPQAEISFNYLGQADQTLRSSSYFVPGRESRGSESAAENRRQNLLSVSGIVLQGKLQLNWRYSEKLHRRETIERLARRYVECLRELIAHCRSHEAGGYSPSDFPLSRLKQDDLDRWIGKDEGVEDIYPLSPLQQGMLFHSLYEPATQMYFMQLSCHFDKLNVQVFQRAWESVVQRHAILRTGFLWEGLEEPVQVVRRKVALPWHELDGRAWAKDEQSKRWQDHLQQDRRRGFSLQSAPLLRIALMRTGENSYYFSWSSHHLLMDGWSREIVIKELFMFYEAFHDGRTPALKRPTLYRDYIAWLQNQDDRKAEEFWRQELNGIDAATRLGIERRMEINESGPGPVDVTIGMDSKKTEKLERLARKQQLTLNTVLLGAWALLMSRYGGEGSVVFGTSVSGRSALIDGVEEAVGPFINALPVRVHVEGDQTLLEYLKRLQHQQAAAREYEHSPLMKVQAWSRMPRGTPLFENLVVFENYPAASAMLKQGIEGIIITETQGFMSNHFPLTLTVTVREELSLMATYDRQWFEGRDIERMLGHLRTVLEFMALDVAQRIDEISLLTQSELRQALTEWNQTKAASTGKYVAQLFEDQVARTPEAVAVTYQGERLTYRELDRRANQLGHYLRGLGAGPEMCVGLCLPRGMEMIIGVLGILKAGAAYVPLDPDYPSERLSFMMDDAQIPLLLTHSAIRNSMPAGWMQIVCFDLERREIEALPDSRLEVPVEGDNLAYLIYTSGSTGRPKGVAITHRGLANYLQWAIESYGLRPGAGSPLHSSLSFDLTVTSAYPPLLTGGHVAVLPQSADIQQLAECLRSGGHSLLKLTPSHLRMLGSLLENDNQAARGAGVLVIGGETLNYADLEYWRRAAFETRLINEYGPTETVVGCCVYEVGRSENGAGAVPIGVPVRNMKMYVLDRTLRPAPVGVRGEIYIGGEGVGRGYWGRPDLTAERFVPDPFSESGGERLYRTGDIARYRDDGNIDHLGRSDHQVKVRGYRIELGEIESVLLSHSGVRQAVVVAREDVPGDQRLVGYVVLAENAAKPSLEELHQHLKFTLADYMLPAVLVPLAEIPLTPNGKVDVKALPKPELLSAARELLPGDEVDIQLKNIWEDVLKVSPIGLRQSFFELGGHSLLAIRLVKRIEEQFGRELPLSAVFEAPTIAQMSNIIRHEYRPSRRSNLVPLQPRGSRRPLFFIHPGGGGATGYRNLAQLVGEDQPFYGLQALDEEENERDTELSIEERASQYLAAVREIQPQGPYLLGGWSFGGFVAYEMSQQLLQQGQKVSSLLLLDIIAQTPTSLPCDGDEADELLELTREIDTFEFSLDAVQHCGVEERLQYLVHQLIEAKAVSPEVEISRIRSFLKGLRRRNQSLIDYRLQPYPGPITLIRAENGKSVEGTGISPDDPTSGFSRLSSAPVQVLFTPGTHDDLVFPPHVEKLAEVIRKCLEDAGHQE